MYRMLDCCMTLCIVAGAKHCDAMATLTAAGCGARILGTVALGLTNGQLAGRFDCSYTYKVAVPALTEILLDVSATPALVYPVVNRATAPFVTDTTVVGPAADAGS